MGAGTQLGWVLCFATELLQFACMTFVRQESRPDPLFYNLIPAYPGFGVKLKMHIHCTKPDSADAMAAPDSGGLSGLLCSTAR